MPPAQSRRRPARKGCKPVKTVGKNKRNPLRTITNSQDDPNASSSSQFPSKAMCPRETSLLSLPDEAISHMYSYLKASDTNGTFKAPRDAFSLAQTNTRLLRLFSKQLTCISPDIGHDYLPTLSQGHMSSVCSLAGDSLRELHLSRSASQVLAELPDRCPNLEKLVIKEPIDSESCLLINAVQKLSLRCLSIIQPMPHTLQRLSRLAVLPREELSLIEMEEECLPGFINMLNLPPRKLSVSTDDIWRDSAPKFWKYLRRACPKIEELSVKAPEASFWLDLVGEQEDFEDNFIADAKRFLTRSRRNENSVCKKMILEGDVFGLIEQAHPKAIIEITRLNQTFIYDGTGVYAKKLPLYDHYLKLDLSRLKEIRIGRHVNPKWKDLLSGKQLSKVYVDYPDNAAPLNLSMDVVEIPTLAVKGTNWEWLNRSKKVHLMDVCERSYTSAKAEFWPSLVSLLSQFCGDTMWMEPMSACLIPKDYDVFKRAVRDIFGEVDKFESCGGDACTVKAMVHCVDQRSKPGVEFTPLQTRHLLSVLNHYFLHFSE